MMLKVRYILSELKQDARGGVMVLIGVSIALLIAFMGVAIDSGRYFLVRNKMNAALDAAILGAADIASPQLQASDPEAIVEKGREYFRANFPTNYLGTTINDGDITINYDETTGSVSGDVQGDIPFVFDGIYNLFSDGGAKTQANMDVFSEVVKTLDDRALEVALVVDNSSSMCFEVGTGPVWGSAAVRDEPNCEKFGRVKTDVADLITTVNDAVSATGNEEASAFFSYIPFTHDVRINGSTKNMNFCNASERDKIPSAFGLRSDTNSLQSLINGTDISVESGTNSAVGIWWGWASLRQDSIGRFVGSSSHEDTSEHPAPLEEVATLETIKAMIILSDGENAYTNFRCPATALSGNYSSVRGVHQDTKVDELQENLCDSVNREGIIVYTVAYDVPCDSGVARRLEGCATRPANFFCATDSDDLSLAFGRIANSLIDLRITQ